MPETLLLPAMFLSVAVPMFVAIAVLGSDRVSEMRHQRLVARCMRGI